MFLVVPPLGKKYSYAFHAKVHDYINTKLFVLYAWQSSGQQLACVPLAHLNIEIQMTVCVYEGGQSSCCS